MAGQLAHYLDEQRKGQLLKRMCTRIKQLGYSLWNQPHLLQVDLEATSELDFQVRTQCAATNAPTRKVARGIIPLAHFLGIGRQQTRRWHRRQNKFGKLWEQTEVTVRLVVSYFNWIWQHSEFKTTAAQRAGLADSS